MEPVSIFMKCLKTFGKLQALLTFLSISMSSYGQTIATLEVNLNDAAGSSLQVPVHLMLDRITQLPDSALALVEIQGRKKIPVAFQLEENTDRKITWLVPDNPQKHVYELVTRTVARDHAPAISAVKQDGSLTLRAGEENLLRYQFETVLPPQGVDPIFRRSAFIHPLWAPHGQVLTRIQPPDHHHHYGLWNPWTHVLFEGDTVDFWNLVAKQGTVRFAGFNSITTGNVFAEYAVRHEHVAFGKGGQEKVAIDEIQTVRVYVPQNSKDYYIADITVQMNCPGSEVRLLEYRYGGLGWRATEQWTKENSKVLTSEGKTRKEADGSKARWCIVEGTVDGENAGAVMMSYPTNYNYPEPLRIWPENANRNRGDMFANFSPTKDMDWLLEPGKNYVLKYRFIVFNGSFSKEKAEAAWKYFASPPQVTVVKTTKKY